MTTSVDDEDPFNEEQKYVSTNTAYPIRIEIEGRHVLSHVFKICTDYGSVNSRNRLLKYRTPSKKTYDTGHQNKMKKVPLFVFRQGLFQHYHIYSPLAFLVQLYPLVSHH